MQSSLVRPAVIGGVVAGVLSVLPVVSIGNLCCCLWVITGGVVASYLLQQDRPGPITLSDGAVVGLFAGMVGAAVSLLLSIPLTLMMAPFQERLLEQLIDSGSLPPEVRDYMAGAAINSLGLIAMFFVMLVAGVIFSTLGGVIGAAIFRKPQPPIVVADVPPAP